MQDIKRSIEATMDRTGALPCLWQLCLLFIVTLFNHVAHDHLQDISPITKATGQQVDISKNLIFRWLESVLYYSHDSSFPSSVYEKARYYVRPCEDIGDAFIYQVFDAKTLKVLARSNICPMGESISQDLWVTFP